MMSLGELQITFPLFVAPEIHPITSYPKTLTADEDFCYEDITFLLRMT
jgi:hypothetical protein